MKRSIRTVLYILIAAAFVVLVVAANVRRSNNPVVGLRIELNYNDAAVLVTEKTLQHQLLAEMPYIMGQKVKDLNIDAIEQYLRHTPYLEQCQVNVSIGRKLVVRATQRRPIVRLFYDNQEFYLDAVGHYVPLSSEGNANVIVANGEFRERLAKNCSQLDVAALAVDTAKYHYGIVAIYRLASYLDTHPAYAALFDQIYLSSNGDLMLTPKLGNHIINLGDVNDLNTKFRNLWSLYTEAMPKVGWDAYYLINLKYRDQVVCKKRN